MELAINFVKNDDIRILRDIEQYYSTQLEEMPKNMAELISWGFVDNNEINLNIILRRTLLNRSLYTSLNPCDSSPSPPPHHDQPYHTSTKQPIILSGILNHDINTHAGGLHSSSWLYDISLIDANCNKSCTVANDESH